MEDLRKALAQERRLLQTEERKHERLVKQFKTFGDEQALDRVYAALRDANGGENVARTLGVTMQFVRRFERLRLEQQKQRLWALRTRGHGNAGSRESQEEGRTMVDRWWEELRMESGNVIEAGTALMNDVIILQAYRKGSFLRFSTRRKGCVVTVELETGSVHGGLRMKSLDPGIFSPPTQETEEIQHTSAKAFVVEVLWKQIDKYIS